MKTLSLNDEGSENRSEGSENISGIVIVAPGPGANRTVYNIYIYIYIIRIIIIIARVM